MKRLSILFHILKVTGFATFLTSFLSYVLLSSTILWLHEPNFTSFGDSLWYTMVTATTVGYGDLTVTTTLGRIISISLALYGVLLFGCLSGIVISYYTEVNKQYSLAIAAKKDKHSTDKTD